MAKAKVNLEELQANGYSPELNEKFIATQYLLTKYLEQKTLDHKIYLEQFGLNSAFEHDINLIVRNHKIYNAKVTKLIELDKSRRREAFDDYKTIIADLDKYFNNLKKK